jgi:hypothetical protein
LLLRTRAGGRLINGIHAHPQTRELPAAAGEEEPGGAA